jgi:hypothetical protein
MDVLELVGGPAAPPPVPRPWWAATCTALGHRALVALVLAGAPFVPGGWSAAERWDECWAAGWDGRWHAASEGGGRR